MWWKYPPYDPAGITAMLAAKVIRELILAFACPTNPGFPDKNKDFCR